MFSAGEFGGILYNITVSVIMFGCDNPLVKDFIDNFYEEKEVSIKPGNTGSARFSLNSLIEKYESQYVIVSEKVKLPY